MEYNLAVNKGLGNPSFRTQVVIVDCLEFLKGAGVLIAAGDNNHHQNSQLTELKQRSCKKTL